MNLEKVIFAFFIILALSVNTSFFISGLIAPDNLQAIELAAALIVSLICTVLKFGDRTQYGSTVLAASLVVDLLLITAAILWGIASASSLSLSTAQTATILSLAGGALIANFLSVILLIIETSQLRK